MSAIANGWAERLANDADNHSQSEGWRRETIHVLFARESRILTESVQTTSLTVNWLARLASVCIFLHLNRNWDEREKPIDIMIEGWIICTVRTFTTCRLRPCDCAENATANAIMQEEMQIQHKDQVTGRSILTWKETEKINGVEVRLLRITRSASSGQNVSHLHLLWAPSDSFWTLKIFPRWFVDSPVRINRNKRRSNSLTTQFSLHRFWTHWGPQIPRHGLRLCWRYLCLTTTESKVFQNQSSRKLPR